MKKFNVKEDNKPFEFAYEEVEEEEKSYRKGNRVIQFPTLNYRKYNNNNRNNIIRDQHNQVHVNMNNNTEVNYTNLEINDDSIMLNNENANCSYYKEQIIDEDIEIFKKRFSIVIKNFQAETIKEIIGLKKTMSIKQSQIIESEKENFELILKSKEDMIESLNNDLQTHIVIKGKLIDQRVKDKMMKHNIRLKQLAFVSVLKKHYRIKQERKRKEALLRKQYEMGLKDKGVRNLNSNWKEMKINKLIYSKDTEWRIKLKEKVQYYNQEISHLKSELKEANRITDKTKEAKNAIQDKLKKVVMKGVMAMNMEAMNILDKDTEADNKNISRKQTQKEDEDQLDEINDDNNNNRSQSDIFQSFNSDNMTNAFYNKTIPKQYSSNDINQKYHNMFQIERNHYSEQRQGPSIPNINLNRNKLLNEAYENEVNMEILDTCKSEEMSSRQKNQLIQFNPFENEYTNNSQVDNYKDDDLKEDMQRSKNRFIIIDYPSVKNTPNTIKEYPLIEKYIKNKENANDYNQSLHLNKENHCVNSIDNTIGKHKTKSRVINNSNITNNYQLMSNKNINVHTYSGPIMKTEFKPDQLTKPRPNSNIKSNQ